MFERIVGVAVLVWFYQTAKAHQQNTFKWAIIGEVGYWIVWWIVTLTVANPLLNGINKAPVLLLFLIRIIPAIAAAASSVLVRKKLLSDLSKSQ